MNKKINKIKTNKWPIMMNKWTKEGTHQAQLRIEAALINSIPSSHNCVSDAIQVTVNITK